MTFLEQLQSHRGGLLRLKTELYWYGDGRGYDRSPGRVCLLLDAAANGDAKVPWKAPSTAAARARTAAGPRAAAHLLIDGTPHWVWVVEADVELL